MSVPYGMKTYLTTLTLILATGLLQGCSGHALQDLIDGGESQDTSSKNTEKNSNERKVSPSQNSALQSISPSVTASDSHAEYRYMQKNTNEWLEKEWEPLTENNTTGVENRNSLNNNKDKTIESGDDDTTSKDDSNATGLQYYVDKAELYFENKKKRDANKTKAPSHVDKIDKMPGIGKKTTR